MECQRLAKLLVVLTLLLQCRAELKDVQPRWYSANLINNGFQPKSIADLFSTEPSFSTGNPIIVSSTPSNHLSRDFNLPSTLAPPKSQSTSTSSEFSSTTFSPLSQSTIPPCQQQYIPQINQNQQLFNLDQPSSVEIHQQTSPADFEFIQPMLPQRNVQIQQTQSSTQTLPQSSPVIKLATFYQQPTDATLSTEIRYDFQDIQPGLGPQSSSASPETIPPLSNYFLMPQQGPQSIQGSTYPSSSPRTTATETFTTSPVTSTFPSTISSTTPKFFTTESPSTIRTSPVFYSTTGTLVHQELSTLSSPVTVSGCTKVESTTQIPRKTIPGIRPFGGNFPLHIRVSAPSGSITNVNFNAPSKRSSTTRKPTTTTRKPTTRRPPKPKKNTYDRCLLGCRKNGQTVCAAPLSQNPVDPKTLRGFQSVCHMACHNSYRKYPYEKLVDGSCGKLRTRIRPVDTNTKLKKDELTKVQYIVDNSGQQAILEFSGAYV